MNEENAAKIFLNRIQMVDGVPSGKYIMWRVERSSNEKLSIKNLQTYNEIYANSSGIYTRLLGSILSSLGAVSGDVKRMKFPKDPLTIYLLVDGKNPVVLTISSEKGIRFHFSENDSRMDFGADFLLNYRNFVNSLKKVVAGKGLALDDVMEIEPQKWWNATSSVSDVNEIGSLVVE